MPSPFPRLADDRPKDALAAAAAALVLALFFAPAILGPGQFLSRDAGRLHAPMKRWVAERLAGGRLPEWNPYDGLGAPVVANAVDAVQHPFNLLLVALPFDAAFKAWVLLSYLLAATGGLAWLRALRCSRWAASAGGLAYALSGVLVSTSDNLTYLTAFAALPWVLAAGLLFARARTPERMLGVALASALCAAAGDPQAWGFAVLALCVQPAVLDRAEGGGGAAVRGGLAAAAALAGAAPFILPVAAWMPHSSRAAALGDLDQVRFALAPLRLLELGLPGLTRGAAGTTVSEVYRRFAADPLGVPWYVSVYAGASVLALAALGARRDRRARALLAAAAVLTWMALGHRAGFGQLAQRVPVLSGFRFWEKLAVWPTLLLSGAAAVGLDAFLAGGARRAGWSRWLGGMAAVAGLAAAVALVAAGRLPAAPDPALLPPPPDALARQLLENVARGALHAALALAGLAVLQGLTAGRATLAPEASFAARRPALAEAPAAALWAVVVLDLALGNAGAWALSPAWIAEPHGPIADRLAAAPGLERVLTPFQIGERRHPSFPELAPSQEAWCVAGRLLYASFNVPRKVGNFEPAAPLSPERVAELARRLSPRKLLPAAGLFGVSAVVVPRAPEAAAGAGLPAPYVQAGVDPAIPAWLVEVPHRPRAYLARRVAAATREEAFAFAAGWSGEQAELTVLEGPVPRDLRPPGGEARVAVDAPEHVQLEVRTDTHSLLVLSDAYAPGWTATVDGRRAEIFPANALARGVWVEPGAHVVDFRYRTPGLAIGWCVFLALGIGAGAWRLRERARAGAA